MKNLKSLCIGASVAAINIVPAATQIFRVEGCTGACGSCGFSCIGSIAGTSLIVFSALGAKKIRGKFVKKKDLNSEV